jgi:diguanylate cyclase (GGDEF)-like protein/PAS domain S-box-containing protein
VTPRDDTDRRPAGRAARLRVAALLGCAAAVIAAMLVMADREQARADRARASQVHIERLRSAGVRVDALTWRTIATSERGAVPPSVVAEGLAVYRDVGRSLRQMRRLGMPAARLATVEGRIGEAYGVGLRALTLSRADPAAAQRLTRDRFAPAMQRVDKAVARIAERQRRDARAAVVRTRLGLLGSLLSGLALLALLGWRSHRTERRNALAEHARDVERRGEQRLHALVRHSSDVVAVVDAAGTIRWLAESVEAVLGHDPAALVGSPLAALAHPEDAHRVARFLGQAAEGEGRMGLLSVRVRTADGGHRPIEMIANNHLADPLIDGILLNLRDVSERVELEGRLRHQAFHDTLTGLANRALFEDRLAQALVRGLRGGGLPAVLFIDLDDFKTVNDSLGHAAGDELLQAVAARLDAAVRAQDTVARLGGDEFAVLLEDLAGADEALTLAERVGAALAPPLALAGREVRPSASIGVARAERGEATAEELLRNADVAMYAAKERGKAQVAGFEPHMHEEVVERLELTGELAAAIEAGDLALQYQPIVDLQGGGIVAVEALVRWNHPVRGRLAPDRFIPLAESSGLIVPLGDWVLTTAARQLHDWDARDAGARGLGISVNVSTRQIAEPGYPDRVAATLAATGIAPGRVTLEITERLLVHDDDHMLSQLGALEAIGVRLAVDDFGTGYSALGYLQSFPIEELKIDRAFVSGIATDEEQRSVVRAIIEMSHSLRLKVVTEGVEEPAVADLLRDLGSDFAQGYLFSRPVEAGQVEALVRDAAVPAPAGAA